MDGGGDQWTPGLAAELFVNDKFRKGRAMTFKHTPNGGSTVLPRIVPVQLAQRWPWLNTTSYKFNQRYESTKGMVRRNLAEMEGQ